MYISNIFLTITILLIPIHSVLNATNVGNSFLSLAQISAALVISVIICSHHISTPHIRAGKITAAFANQAAASTIF